MPWQASGAASARAMTTETCAEACVRTLRCPENRPTLRYEAEQAALGRFTMVEIELTTIGKRWGLLTVRTSSVESPGYRPPTDPPIRNVPRGTRATCFPERSEASCHEVPSPWSVGLSARPAWSAAAATPTATTSGMTPSRRRRVRDRAPDALRDGLISSFAGSLAAFLSATAPAGP